MKKDSLQEELKGLSPELNGLKEQPDGFRVPEDYFDALESSVFSRIDAMEIRRQAAGRLPKNKGLRVWLYRPRTYAAVAAVFAVILAAVWFFAPGPQQTETPAVVQTELLSEEELIEAYVLENIADFDANQLAGVSPAHEETIPATPENLKKQTHPLDDISQEELELLLREMSDEELESML